MSFKYFLVILTLFCLQAEINGLRSYESLKKSNNISPPSSSLQIVHYVVRNPDNTYKIENIGVKNLKINYNRNWLAKSTWDDSYNTTGWSVLQIETNENATDVDQAYAAGLLEGSLTKDLISLHLLNNVGNFCQDSSDICQKLIAFLTENFKWMNDQIKENIDDPYWHQINLALTQLGGIFNGYNQTFDSSIDIEIFPKLIENRVDSFLSLLLLNLGGDLGEILAAITKTANPFYAGSCSALIKVLENNSDLFVSHDTWDEFESMLRIMKFYKFYYHYNYQDPVHVPGTQMTFSSYPGTIISMDDFYQTNANLAIIETTIGNSNADLWQYVTPHLNLYWVRNLAANRLASNGAEWAKWFSLFNSGTYNNQWMIVDYNQFTPNQPLRDGLLTVLEQIPGYIVWEDKTDVLRTQSHWPSYNLPYYPFIYNISGVYDAYLKYGDFFSYTNSPRANIFRRDHSNVSDVNSMIKMMRYNDYTNDPLSRCDKCSPPYSAENTIAARSDLNPANGTYPFEALGHRDHGATDMKLTSWSMNQKLEFIGISGPTHGFPNVPPFVWSLSDFNNNTNHFGQPDKWQFDPLHIQWSL